MFLISNMNNFQYSEWSSLYLQFRRLNLAFHFYLLLGIGWSTCDCHGFSFNGFYLLEFVSTPLLHVSLLGSEYKI